MMVEAMRTIIERLMEDETAMRILVTLYNMNAISSNSATSVRQVAKVMNLHPYVIARKIRGSKGCYPRLLMFVHYPQPNRHNRLYLTPAGVFLARLIANGKTVTRKHIVRLISLLSQPKLRALKAKTPAIAKVSKRNRHTTVTQLSHDCHTTVTQLSHLNPNNPNNPYPLITLNEKESEVKTGKEAEGEQRTGEPIGMKEGWDEKMQTKKLTGVANCPRCGKKVIERYLWTASDLVRENADKVGELAKWDKAYLCEQCFKACNQMQAFAILKIATEKVKEVG